MINLEPLLAVTGIPVNVAVLDAVGTIIGVNAPWRSFADANGSRMRDHGVGLNYLAHCGEDATGAAVRSDLTRLLNGQLDILTTNYPCHSPDQMRWCLMIGLPLARSRPAGAMLLHANLTDLLPMVLSARELAFAVQPTSPHQSALTLQSIADFVRRSVTSALAGLFAGDTVTSVASTSADDSEAADRRQVERAHLSLRHQQVFAMLGEGRSNADIAAALGVSPNTVKVHVSEILKRLGFQSRTQVALLASKIARRAERSRPIFVSGARRIVPKRPKQ
jgi:DNA-binding CsgD family transcriptional regulator